MHGNEMDQISGLSPREHEVTNLLLQGKSNKQIAFSLGISERTVEFHLNNVFEKEAVSSRVELILKLGKSTGEYPVKPVESTVDIGNEITHNGKQTDAERQVFQDAEKGAPVDTKEFAMENKIKSVLVLVVLVLGVVLMVGGIITEKYGAVVVGICVAAGASVQLVTTYRKKKAP